jgi:hypothetical protein
MPADQVQTRRPRRWFRFSLRTLFVLVAIVAVLLGIHVRGVRNQEAAVERILELGGYAFFEYQCDESGVALPEPRRSQVSPRGPQWLRSWLGPHHFNAVVAVGLGGTQATDDDLECLEELPRLKRVSLSPSRIGNDGLVHLKNAHDLRYLSLERTQVDDGGMKHIAHLTALENLQLPENITDDGLGQLGGLTRLRSLVLNRTRITDDGLQHVTAFKDLAMLHFWRTQISDTGLEHLKVLKNLKSLDARGTHVTAHGAEELQRELPGLGILMN